MKINENGLIYEIQMENGVEVARFIKCAFLRLDIRCMDTVAVNQELDVTIAYLGYEGNPQANSENITVQVIFEGEVVAERTITPINGTGNLVLEFAGPGEYRISATGNCTCEPAEKKVIVNG
ncbi:MAG: hypothetical protein ACOX0E_06665 [Syntrophomonadaceae bacterium]